MHGPETSHVELELDPGDPIRGRIARGGQPGEPFRGWLELATKLERLRMKSNSAQARRLRHRPSSEDETV
jgi:hypothetical protein